MRIALQSYLHQGYAVLLNAATQNRVAQVTSCWHKQNQNSLFGVMLCTILLAIIYCVRVTYSRFIFYLPTRQVNAEFTNMFYNKIILYRSNNFLTQFVDVFAIFHKFFLLYFMRVCVLYRAMCISTYLVLGIGVS